MPPGRDLIIRLYGLALQIMVGLCWLALGRDSVVRTEMGRHGEQKGMNTLCNMPSVKS